jgi:hypothetical protein
MNFPFRIPTIVGLLLCVVVVGTIIFFTERALRAPSGASGSQQPQSVKITNITNTTFAVSWMTESPTTGTLLVSTRGKSNRVYYDERDAQGKLNSYRSHHITIRDAQPSTTYTFKILSNGKSYTNDGQPYTVTTADTLPPNPAGLDPAYGTIYTPEGVVADGALVYLTVAGGQELSALTKPTGLWLIPLNLVRTADFTSFLPTLERMDETIVVMHETGDINAMTDTLNDSPVPEMTIGQTHDFRRQNAKTTTNNTVALRATTPTTAPLAIATQPPIGGAVLGTTINQNVTLASPAQGASLTSTLPLIQGTGVPGKFIAISLGITQPISGSSLVKQDGTWSFTPPKALSAGKQSVTITTVDKNNKPVAITHAFQIFKSGTQVLGDATPSATLSVTPTATPFLISSISATPVVTEIATLSGEEIPTSGYELPTILLLIMGVALLASGVVAIAL